MNENLEQGENLILDPAAMNIVNRIAPGSRSVGTFECDGGLVVQGRVEGTLSVRGGPLVLMPEGTICGSISCDQDVYLSGSVEPRDDGSLSEIVAAGAAFCAETLVAKANITAGALKTYQGAQVEGVIKTVRRQ